MKPKWQYPPVGPSDLGWGLVCYSSGHASVNPGEPYPPGTAIEQYVFNPAKGRIISEYQLIYLTKGRGTFYCDTLGRNNGIQVKAGDAFLLFPGEWHTYMPDADTGWEEYWIDFLGSIPDSWLQNGLIRKNEPIYHIGIQPGIVRKYTEASSVLEQQKSSYQQALCGICTGIICDVFYIDRNRMFESSHVADIIGYSKAIIDEQFRTIKGEDLAKMSGMGYTKFRELFKEYTGITVGTYISDIRISRAKQLLSESKLSIKEIAYECGYVNADYFSVIFRKSTGETARQYRQNLHGGMQ